MQACRAAFKIACRYLCMEKLHELESLRLTVALSLSNVTGTVPRYGGLALNDSAIPWLRADQFSLIRTGPTRG